MQVQQGAWVWRGWIDMARMSKRFRQVRESIDKDKRYTLEEGCELVKELATAGFD